MTSRCPLQQHWGNGSPQVINHADDYLVSSPNNTRGNAPLVINHADNLPVCSPTTLDGTVCPLVINLVDGLPASSPKHWRQWLNLM